MASQAARIIETEGELERMDAGPSSERKASSAPGTVLFVDGDPKLAEIVAPALERRGYVLVRAGSAAEARAELARRRFDLLVVDAALPDLEGERFVAERREAGDGVPVVLVATLWMQPAKLEALGGSIGTGLVVSKPVIPSVFALQIDRLVAPGRKAGADASPVGSGDVGPSAPDDPTARELAALRAKYGRDLPGKVRELAGAVAGARARPGERHLLVEARKQAHRLRGTAGCYGFPGVGEACGRVEEALSQRLSPVVLAAEVASGASDAASAVDRSEVDWSQIERALADAAREARPAEAFSSVGSFAVVKGRMLVVDDDPDFLHHVAELARAHLVEIVAATSSDAALELAQKTPPDAALLDVTLEGGASYQLARKLRALPGCDNLPLAFASEASDVHNRVAAAHAGASLYLSKPIDTHAFGAAVHHLMSLRQMDRPRVLVVDDDPDFSSRVAAVLKGEGMTVTVVSEGSQILDALDRIQPDLLLLDVMMPGLSGFDVARMLRTTPRWQELPILFLTSQGEVETRMAAFESGGDDFLQKPVLDAELLARIRVRVERSRLLRDRAGKDSLTGLLLRRSFMEELSARLAEARRHKRPLSLALLDIDHFKVTNDTYGHLAGDRVLVGLAKLISSRFRSEDLRGRWGGEEFILGFPGESPETAAGVLSRLLSETQTTEFIGEAGERFFVTFSAGIACATEDGETVEALLKAADRRLYLAKRAGRARLVIDG